jgi:hypothetical protein
MNLEELIALACRTADSLTDNKGRLEFVFDDAGLERFAEVLAAADTELKQLKADRDALRDLYNELLFSVGNKYPNETRHQTALRYITQAETTAYDAAREVKP